MIFRTFLKLYIDDFEGSTSTSGKSPEKSGKTSEPIQKKLKKKSIFSPENSSESDSGVSAKINTVKPINVSSKCSKNPQAKTKINEVKQQKTSITSRAGSILFDNNNSNLLVNFHRPFRIILT